MLKELRAKVGLFVSGKYGQFNLFVLTSCTVLLLGFWLVNRLLSETSLVVGNCVVASFFMGLFAVSAAYFLRQKPRGNSEGVPSVEADIGAGRVKLVNPPDSFYEREQMTAFFRLMTVGFDENLCPDGEVIGNVADKNIRKLSENEKQAFRAKHIEDIKLARKRIAQTLSDGGSRPAQQTPSVDNLPERTGKSQPTDGSGKSSPEV